MAKMAESNDFRPFKFRIQAFTNAFMDAVCIHNIREPSFGTAETTFNSLLSTAWVKMSSPKKRYAW